MLVDYKAGGAVEVSCATVVAEPLPGLEDPVLGGSRQVPDGRKGLQEPLIVGDDRLDPGLLEHDL